MGCSHPVFIVPPRGRSVFSSAVCTADQYLATRSAAKGICTAHPRASTTSHASPLSATHPQPSDTHTAPSHRPTSHFSFSIRHDVQPALAQLAGPCCLALGIFCAQPVQGLLSSITASAQHLKPVTRAHGIAPEKVRPCAVTDSFSPQVESQLLPLPTSVPGL